MSSRHTSSYSVRALQLKDLDLTTFLKHVIKLKRPVQQFSVWGNHSGMSQLILVRLLFLLAISV